MEKFKKVDIHDFKKIRQIGRGVYGKVYLVQNIKTNELLAAKVIDLDLEELVRNGTINDSIGLDIYREIEVISSLNHPTLIRFHGYSFLDFDDKKAVTLFLNYLENGALKNFCYEKYRLPNKKYDSTARQIILVGIAYGMKLFHQKGGIHRDLKPENILVDKELHPVITDFGCAKIMSSDILYQTEGKGSPYYMAPEMNGSNNDYDNKVDVYSFSILMFEIVTETFCYPNNELSSYVFIKQVKESYLRPTFPPEKPVKPAIRKLIELCWSNDPDIRPSFEDIFNCLAYNDDSCIEFDKSEGIVKDEDNHDDKKYYLDGVDVEKLLEYVSFITKDEQQNDEEEEEEEEELAELSETYSESEKSSQKVLTDDDSENSEDQKNVIKKEANKGKQKITNPPKQAQKQTDISSQKVKNDYNIKKPHKKPGTDSNKQSKEKAENSKKANQSKEKQPSKQNQNKGQKLTKSKKVVKKKSDDDNNYKLSDFSQAEIDALDDDDDDELIWKHKFQERSISINKSQKSDTHFQSSHIRSKSSIGGSAHSKSSENFKRKGNRSRSSSRQSTSHFTDSNRSSRPYKNRKSGNHHKSGGQSNYHTLGNAVGGGNNNNYKPGTSHTSSKSFTSGKQSSLSKSKLPSQSTNNVQKAVQKKPVSQTSNQTNDVKTFQAEKTTNSFCNLQ